MLLDVLLSVGGKFAVQTPRQTAQTAGECCDAVQRLQVTEDFGFV